MLTEIFLTLLEMCGLYFPDTWYELAKTAKANDLEKLRLVKNLTRIVIERNDELEVVKDELQQYKDVYNKQTEVLNKMFINLKQYRNENEIQSTLIKNLKLELKEVEEKSNKDIYFLVSKIKNLQMIVKEQNVQIKNLNDIIISLKTSPIDSKKD